MYGAEFITEQSLRDEANPKCSQKNRISHAEMVEVKKADLGLSLTSWSEISSSYGRLQNLEIKIESNPRVRFKKALKIEIDPVPDGSKTNGNFFTKPKNCKPSRH
ncbi:hypothetical protein SLE2022_203250 [Rubroshorea leprosula]